MVAHKHLSALLLTAIIVGASFGAAAAQRPAQEPGPLFIPINQPALDHQQVEMAVTRSRSALIDWSTLQAARPGETLQLNLFDDIILHTTISSVTSEDGVTTWVGNVEGELLAQVILVSTDGVISGSVSMAAGYYQVRSTGGEIHAIQQIDQSAYPEELPPVVVGPEQLAEAGLFESAELDEPEDMNDSAGTIDVLVLYTPAARSTAGSHSAIRALINQAVAETNQSYLNSGITQRIRLVHSQEINYTEASGMDMDLAYLQSTTDTYLNEAHTLRNTYRADLVSLIVEGFQYCGIAYMMDSVSSSFAPYGFSVVARSCATGYYSFAHELGHNMGAGHDWYVNTSTTPYTYSHGYVNVENRWRTIMAYNNECTANGVNCTRIPYWSNPSIDWMDDPMGFPAGSSTSCGYGQKTHPDCDADDHRALNNTAQTVANFRQSLAPAPTPVPLSNFAFKRFIPLLVR